MAACGEVWKCGYVEKSVDNFQKNGKKGLKKNNLWITWVPVDIFSGTLGKAEQNKRKAPSVFHPSESRLTWRMEATGISHPLGERMSFPRTVTRSPFPRARRPSVREFL
jgi:hypothetical protein